ncbi:MAG: tetratricopeptide repeat protein [Euryarchaeota archaeon TMED85]|nr:MAG: tetratricopeptide repeat protein [Euryarchaeota archaeon TMED85]|tara:strand:+ start:237 stop:1025 length:789 start_codon:yes stop_codon:yes gene_type:complete
MVKKYFNSIIIILLMTFSNICNSQEEYNSSILIDKFTEANNFYNNSKYEKSIEIYLEILDSGHHSAELYYNLGNSFYKLNNIANSILYYEKSIKLNTKDKDAINNLKMVNNGIIDDIIKMPEPFINNQLDNISNNFSYSSWGSISIIFSFLFLLIFVIYFFSKDTIVKRASFIFLFILFILIGITLKISFNAYEKNYLEKYAIIFSKKIEIKADPNERSENLLTLHMGTKVKIIDTFNDKWVKIKLVNGQEGWVNNNEIKII